MVLKMLVSSLYTPDQFTQRSLRLQEYLRQRVWPQTSPTPRSRKRRAGCQTPLESYFGTCVPDACCCGSPIVL
ncbi:hypothetical protein E2C01_081468 [Portunus trituberculatus]|uniref:Uncharacterized protein n=1 Tax=Portunus trituberculatus TaxID=210409 RepID=A0A5B7J2E6_PORTR|nr:hypothetical protein [Portunus trituberculatus]